LLNALVHEERAIVSDIAGTTRDTIEEAFVIDGITFRLIDTAGIRAHTTDTIESIGIERTFEKINQASIIIYLFDASTTSDAELEQELKQFETTKATVIAVANKVDLLKEIPNTLQLHKELIQMSSLQKTGLDALTKRLKDLIDSDAIKSDVVVSNLRHYEALLLTAESLTSVLESMEMQQSGELLAFDIRKAIYHLGEIVGEITTDDLLTNIFSKFCIGK
jgi:tRNA modification GTPase